MGGGGREGKGRGKYWKVERERETCGMRSGIRGIGEKRKNDREKER